METVFFVSGYPVYDDAQGLEVYNNLTEWLKTWYAKGYRTVHESYIPVMKGDGNIYMGVVVRMEHTVKPKAMRGQ